MIRLFDNKIKIQLLLLLSLLLVAGVGCTKKPTVKAEPPKPAAEIKKDTPEKPSVDPKLVKKYEDKLTINMDGVHFFHSLECSGAIRNRFQDYEYDPKTSKQTGYKQVIKCRTGETHTIIFSKIKYNEKGYKDSYELILKCSKQNEEYKIKISDIKYDYTAQAISYKLNINGDELLYPLPKEKKESAK